MSDFHLLHAGIEILEVGSIISSEEDGLIYILNDQFTEKDTWPG